MKRRGFLQSAAAVAFAPFVFQSPKTRDEFDPTKSYGKVIEYTDKELELMVRGRLEAWVNEKIPAKYRGKVRWKTKEFNYGRSWAMAALYWGTSA